MGNTKKVFEELQKKNNTETSETAVEKKKTAPTSFHQKKATLPYNAAHYTTGEAAESFTSTALNTYTASTRALIDEEEFMYKKIKKKSYARIITNYGNINVELHSDKVKSRRRRKRHSIVMETDYAEFRFPEPVIISCNLQKLDTIIMSFSIET